MFDIFFLSCGETNAEKNYRTAKRRYPFIKRIIDAKSIAEAHILAAQNSYTEYFYTIDADNILLTDVELDHIPHINHINKVHVWRSQNNLYRDLNYGNGGIKLWPKRKVLGFSKPYLDFTMSFEFISIDETLSINEFNTSEFETWRTAFRECVKLSLSDKWYDQERLDIWCSYEHIDKQGKYYELALKGANDGKEYSRNNALNTNAIQKINDRAFLLSLYEA